MEIKNLFNKITSKIRDSFSNKNTSHAFFIQKGADIKIIYKGSCGDNLQFLSLIEISNFIKENNIVNYKIVVFTALDDVIVRYKDSDCIDLIDRNKFFICRDESRSLLFIYKKSYIEEIYSEFEKYGLCINSILPSHILAINKLLKEDLNNFVVNDKNAKLIIEKSNDSLKIVSLFKDNLNINDKNWQKVNSVNFNSLMNDNEDYINHLYNSDVISLSTEENNPIWGIGLNTESVIRLFIKNFIKGGFKYIAHTIISLLILSIAVIYWTSSNLDVSRSNAIKFLSDRKIKVVKSSSIEKSLYNFIKQEDRIYKVYRKSFENRLCSKIIEHIININNIISKTTKNIKNFEVEFFNFDIKKLPTEDNSVNCIEYYVKLGISSDNSRILHEVANLLQKHIPKISKLEFKIIKNGEAIYAFKSTQNL